MTTEKQPNQKSKVPSLLNEKERKKLYATYEGLLERYGMPEKEIWDEPLPTLILLILSQHTSDVNSGRAFTNLMTTFGSLENVRLASINDIAIAIKAGGLAQVKAPRLKEVLNQIYAERESLDLSFLKELSLEEARVWLMHLKGVGPKSAACVLLFSLGLPALPVDTHVFRISRRIGLLESRITEAQAHQLLERALSPLQVYYFHVNMIQHGRTTCKALRPLCQNCNLAPFCDFFKLNFTE